MNENLPERSLQCVHDRNRRISLYAVGVVALVFISALAIIGPYDQALSLWLSVRYVQGFVNFFSQVVTSDGRIGASDISLLFQIGCGFYVVYAYKKFRSSPSREKYVFLSPLNRFCVFVVLSSIYTGIVVVHGLKLAVGRARPYMVFGDSALPFSSWYDFGWHSILDGKYPGSFPSGHSASAAAFFAILFLLPPFAALGVPFLPGADDSKHSHSLKSGFKTSRISYLISFMAIAFCFSYWFLMSVARVMGRDHWFTDCLASGLLVFLTYAYFATKFEISDRRPLDALLPKGALVHYFKVLIGSVVLLAGYWILRELTAVSDKL